MLLLSTFNVDPVTVYVSSSPLNCTLLPETLVVPKPGTAGIS
jgi:hypothetical protein